jgi:hypothetical protein
MIIILIEKKGRKKKYTIHTHKQYQLILYVQHKKEHNL